jgi:hypothetical protein
LTPVCRGVGTGCALTEVGVASLLVVGSGVQGFRGSGVQGFKGSGVQGFKGSGVQGFRGSRVQGFRGSDRRLPLSLNEDCI